MEWYEWVYIAFLGIALWVIYGLGYWRGRRDWRAEQPLTIPTHTLLADYSELMNRYGADSEEAWAFWAAHEHDQELISLCRVAYWLKLALDDRK